MSINKNGELPMIVKDFMTANICFVSDTATGMDIAKIMNQNGIGLVPVCEQNGMLLGFITDRDLIINAALLNESNLANILAKDIMTKDIYCVESTENIHHAALYFSKYKVRRLAVIENKKLINILSISDLAKKKLCFQK